jgi:predicted O-linked N-acetylglucosamine transferase (SPINDLY family)
LQQARDLHLKGFLLEAEGLYLEVLKHSPRHADAKNLLGILLAQRGDPESALIWIGEAIAVDPRNPAYRFNYGKTLLQLKRPREACQALERATALGGDQAETHNELGLARMDDGNLKAATVAFRRALSLRPDYMEAHNNLGLALHRQGEYDEAGVSLRRALEFEPQSTQVMSNLGMVLRAQGRAAESAEIYRAALTLNPQDPVVLTNLGNALISLSRYEEAVACFREATAVAPDYAEAHYNWGTAHLRAERLHAAAEKFSDALAKDPNLSEAASNLGSALLDLGRVEEAMDAFRHALSLRPDNMDVHSSLLFSLLLSRETTQQQIFSEHRAWAQRHAARFVSGSSEHRNSPEPERRLRIGYVSGDFRRHSVSQFFEPVLAQHDRGRFEIFCYSNVSFVDATTERLRRRADCWRETSSLSDDAVVDLVRGDGVDILVDLSGHTKHNRLLVFARKPAPVQITWLGYAATTGIGAIDYRISDAIADPAGTETLTSETLIRLPSGFLCYRPPPDAPPVGVLPAFSAGHITFGSFNSLAKVNPAVIGLWKGILAAVPGSRLLIKAQAVVDPDTRAYCLGRFVEQGIAPDRLDFVPSTQTLSEHLATYNRIDIALDPFPYNGTTTTCEALWMGVPVVTLAGDCHAGRVGASLLTRIGMDDMVARTSATYLAAAVNLASDPVRLSALRAGLRDRISASPLVDAVCFTRNLEQAYRSAWQHWCEEARTG